MRVVWSDTWRMWSDVLDIIMWGRRRRVWVTPDVRDVTRHDVHSSAARRQQQVLFLSSYINTSHSCVHLIFDASYQLECLFLLYCEVLQTVFVESTLIECYNCRASTRSVFESNLIKLHRRFHQNNNFLYYFNQEIFTIIMNVRQLLP